MYTIILEGIEIYNNGKLKEAYNKKDLEARNIKTEMKPGWEVWMGRSWNYGLNKNNSYVITYLKAKGKTYAYLSEL